MVLSTYRGTEMLVLYIGGGTVNRSDDLLEAMRLVLGCTVYTLPLGVHVG